MTTTLLHAPTFKGLPFVCTSVNGVAENALVITTYPHRRGQHVLNLGPLGKRWDVEAVFAPDFNGREGYPEDYYPYGWMRFVKALENPERGYFDHPLFGKTLAMCEGYSPQVLPREGFRVSILFVEANLDEPTFTAKLTVGDDTVSEQGAEDRAAELDAQLQALTSLDITPFSTAWVNFTLALNSIDRVITIVDLNVSLNIFHASITAVESTYPLVLDPINYNVQAEMYKLRRDAVVLALRRDAGAEKRIVTWENRSVQSTLEIAVRLYGDPSRAEEIERLNSIVDPLFVPIGTLKVMSDYTP